MERQICFFSYAENLDSKSHHMFIRFCFLEEVFGFFLLVFIVCYFHFIHTLFRLAWSKKDAKVENRKTQDRHLDIRWGYFMYKKSSDKRDRHKASSLIYDLHHKYEPWQAGHGHLLKVNTYFLKFLIFLQMHIVCWI